MKSKKCNTQLESFGKILDKNLFEFVKIFSTDYITDRSAVIVDNKAVFGFMVNIIIAECIMIKLPR